MSEYMCVCVEEFCSEAGFEGLDSGSEVRRDPESRSFKDVCTHVWRSCNRAAAAPHAGVSGCLCALGPSESERWLLLKG